MDPVDQVLADVRAAYSPDPNAKRRVGHGINAAVGTAILSGTHPIAGSQVPTVANTGLGKAPVLKSTALGLKWGAGISIGSIALATWLALSPSNEPMIARGIGEAALTPQQPDVDGESLQLGELKIEVFSQEEGERERRSPGDKHEPSEGAAHAAVTHSDVPGSSSLLEELGMIRRASQLLRDGNRSEARSILNDHKRRFPHSALATERRGLTLIIECKAGTSERLQTSAQKFLAQAPSSPLSAHVKKQCLP